MKINLFKYFSLLVCCFGLNGCGYLISFGQLMFDDTCSNWNCTHYDPAWDTTAKDGQDLSSPQEKRWYEETLTQQERDLLQKNKLICHKRSYENKQLDTRTQMEANWQCHIDLGTPCYKYKGQSPFFNHCCRFDNSSCNSL